MQFAFLFENQFRDYAPYNNMPVKTSCSFYAGNDWVGHTAYRSKRCRRDI